MVHSKSRFRMDIVLRWLEPTSLLVRCGKSQPRESCRSVKRSSVFQKQSHAEAKQAMQWSSSAADGSNTITDINTWIADGSYKMRDGVR